MKRRQFLVRALQAGTLIPLASTGLFARPLARHFFARPSAASDRILVLINLNGGNDGLNTVVPYADPLYFKARPNIKLPTDQVLKLNNDLALHPSMGAVHDMFKAGTAAVVSNVGYPYQDRSHFRSTDIWNSASDAEKVLFTGWVGRYIENAHPEYPAQLPTAPFAIQVSSSTSLLLQGEAGNTGIAIDNPDRFYNLAKGLGSSDSPVPATLAGPELKYVREILEQSNTFSTAINQAMLGSTTNAQYDTDNFSSQLKVVARLINGGLGTTVFVVTLGGFDTHSAQLAQQAALLGRLSRGIKSFFDDITASGNANRVTCITYSEFGRRVNENGSAGTDHGAAAPLFVFGNSVNGGEIYGGNPNLSDLDNRGDIQYTVDFRQVYAAVLEDWMGLTNADAKNALLGDFTKLPLFKTSSSYYADDAVMAGMALEQNAPNPAISGTTVSFTTPIQGYATLRLYSADGRFAGEYLSQTVQAGQHRIPVNVSNIPSGRYLYRLQIGRFQMEKWMTVVR
ncbi:MAG: DUF1501 domain-containing protein [Chlorobi bacterium CHB2]|nr:DUF1501 domain-containing protein [Chlorobi bacterium CHB2]